MTIFTTDVKINYLKNAQRTETEIQLLKKKILVLWH